MFVPVTVAPEVMASVVKTHGFEGVTCTFVAGEDVLADLAPHEARRLFGAAEDRHHDPVGQSAGKPAW